MLSTIFRSRFFAWILLHGFFMFMFLPTFAQIMNLKEIENLANSGDRKENLLRLVEKLPKQEFNGRTLVGMPNYLLQIMYLMANREVKLTNYDIQVAERNLKASFGKFAPTLELSSSYGKSASLGSFNPDSDSAYLSYSDRQTLNLNGKLKKLFETGNELSLNYSQSSINPRTLNFEENYGSSQINDSDNYFSSSLTLGLNIPLRKGSGDVNRIETQSAELSQSGSRLAKQDSIRNTLSVTISLFWTMVSAFENLKLQLETVELAKTTYEELEIRTGLGDVAPIEASQAENLLIIEQQELDSEQLTFINYEQIIKDAVELKHLKLGLYPIFEEETSRPDFSKTGLKKYVEQAIANSVSQKIKLNELAALRLEEKTSLDSTRSELDLNLDYVLQGHGSGVVDPYSGYSQTDIHGYTVGLTYSLPLGNDGSKETLAGVRVRIAKKMKEINDLKSTIELDVEEKLRNLQSSLIFLENAEKQIELRDELFTQENEKFKLGTSTLLTLEQARVNLMDAKKQRILFFSDFRKSYEDFLVFIGEHPVLKNLPKSLAS